MLFEKVVLKGGNALSLALGLSKRTSLDLDFSIDSDFDNLNEVGDRLRTALERRFASAGLVVFDFRFEPKPSTIREDQSPRWGGYMASFKISEQRKFDQFREDVEALRRNSVVIGPMQQRVFTIDLSKYEYVTGKLERELDDYTIYVYSPPMIAIEKLRAICQQMPEYPLKRNPSPRARDFYDIHLITMVVGLDLSAPDNLDLTRHIFAAKEVPLALLGRIKDQREFHRPDWDSVKASVRDETRDYDFYFEFVTGQVALMKALWKK